MAPPAFTRRCLLAALTALAALSPVGQLRAQPESADAPDAAAASLALEYLGAATLPGDRVLAGSVVGGVSGLAWDADRRRFLAVTDDRARPRVFAFDFRLPTAEEDDEPAIAIADAYALPMREDAPHNPRDAEAIAPDGVGGFVVAFESPPAFSRYDASFTSRSVLALMPEDLASRLMPNRSAESLALIPAAGPLGETPALLTITEWGPEPADRNIRGSDRLAARGRPVALALDPETLEVRSRGTYPLGVPFTPKGAKSLVEIAPLGPDAFLALERFAAPGGFFAFELYRAAIEATGESFTIVKTPIDVGSFPGVERVGNVEALAIGPAIDDDKGGRLLLLATDNNFGETAFGRDNTDFLAFRLLSRK